MLRGRAVLIESLQLLGWGPFFAEQVPADGGLVARRVVAVHRTGHALGDGESECVVPLGRSWQRLPVEARPCVGDWVLTDVAGTRIERVLERRSVLRRVASGGKLDFQLIGANIDVALVVTSCTAEFNPSRLHRYLALARDSGIEAMLVLTKADLAEDVAVYRDQALGLAPNIVVETVNALNAESVRAVGRHMRAGATFALLGSSGVGKSTLLNTLADRRLQATGEVREDDGKGRHTTTGRFLHRLPGGALVLDGPGVRELGVADVEEGLDRLFEDIEALAERCRFRDCAHDTEPGCAVQAAVLAGDVDESRLASYRKLSVEQRRLGAELAGQRHRGRKSERLARRERRGDGRGG